MSKSSKDVIDRLVDLIKIEFDDNQTKFGKAIDVPQSTISGCINSKNRILNGRIVEGILKHQPQISIKWLVLGQGEMLVDVEQQDNSISLEARMTKFEERLDTLYKIIGQALNKDLDVIEKKGE